MFVPASSSDLSLRTEVSSVSPPEPLWPVSTHRQWEALVLCVQVVESQVEDQCSHGVEEGKDAQGHEELGGGREVPHEVHGLGCGVTVTEGHLILDPVQPAGGKGGHPELRAILSLWRQVVWAYSHPRTLTELRWGHAGGMILGETLQSPQECP